MTNKYTLSAPVRFAVDVITATVMSLVLLFGGSQSGIVTPTFTWVTGVLVLTGLCLGFLFWRYSIGDGQGLIRPRLSRYPLILFVIGILIFSSLWVGFVPPVYGNDLVYGVLTMVWTSFILLYTV